MAAVPTSAQGMAIVGSAPRRVPTPAESGARVLGGGGLRGVIVDLASPFPLGPTLPALYQEDEFTQRFLQTFDAALAPIFATIDCFPTYLDPEMAPEDFLRWLAGWVGALYDETWPIARRRDLVADAVSLFSMRGTVNGMARHIELYTGGTVEIDDGGGVIASSVPEGELPGYASTHFVVRITVPEGVRLDRRRVEGLIASGKPAHLTHQLEIVHPTTTASPSTQIMPTTPTENAADTSTGPDSSAGPDSPEAGPESP